MKKFMLRVMPIVLVAVIVISGSVFAIDPKEPTNGTAIGDITTLTNNIWSTITVVVQMVAVLAVVIAGVRYMFASADTKADIKQQTIILVVGAILVFAAVPILKFVQSIATNVFNKP